MTEIERAAGAGGKAVEVACVLLTADRPEMTRQAVACFEAQTYPHKRLIIYDTSAARGESFSSARDVVHIFAASPGGTIGDLRNRANAYATEDLIAHWDSDDLSHPKRLEEQVALIQETGVDIVGYRAVPFFDVTRGQAWMYSNLKHNYGIGSSFLYRADIWRRRPFMHRPVNNAATGEDEAFRQGQHMCGVSAIVDGSLPRMVCRIHGGNTADYQSLITLAKRRPQSTSWRRAPELDETCRRICLGAYANG